MNADTRDTPAPMPPLAWLAIILAAIAMIVCLSAATPVVGTIFTASPSDADALEEQDQRIRAYNASFDRHRAQIDGRSLFFIPPEPPPKPKPKPKPRPQEEREPPPPPPPARYGGPKPIAVVFDQVWFQDGRKINVGESDRDLEVISNENSPWSVTLRWKGTEFDVELLERTAERLLQDDGEPSP